MLLRLNSPSSYSFRLKGGLNNVYAFTTLDEISYEVRFVPSAYMFEEHLDVFINAYEMISLVVDNPVGRRIPADDRTGPTIRAIFYDFFQNHERVVIFICDSSDGRQEARARNTDWYYKEVRPRFFKFDMGIQDGDGTILLSVILHVRNTHFDDVVRTIKSLNYEVK